MKLAIAVVLLMLATSASDSEPFAVECHGSAIARGNETGSDYERTSELGRQVYVFHPRKEEISRALFPRQEFEPVCGIAGDTRFVSISPGLLQARSYNGFAATPHNTCEFRLDRMTGEGFHKLRMEWVDGRYHEFDWNFRCEATEVPVFDLGKRRF